MIRAPISAILAALLLCVAPAWAGVSVDIAPTSTPGNTTPVYAGPTTIIGTLNVSDVATLTGGVAAAGKIYTTQTTGLSTGAFLHSGTAPANDSSMSFYASRTIPNLNGTDTVINFNSVMVGTPTWTGTGNSAVAYNAGNTTVVPGAAGDTYGLKIGTGYTVPIIAAPPAAQTIANLDVITADGCGTIKQITAAGAVGTNTTHSFTNPTTRSGCCMDVYNVGAQIITIDTNTTLVVGGAANLALGALDAVRFCSNGTNWLQMTAVISLN